jgi:hypothetical protein
VWREGEATRPGHFLGCLVENKEAVENLACSQYLQRLETVIFSDYRLVANFMNACQVPYDIFSVLKRNL